jgi:hypothetical protein
MVTYERGRHVDDTSTRGLRTACNRPVRIRGNNAPTKRLSNRVTSDDERFLRFALGRISVMCVARAPQLEINLIMKDCNEGCNSSNRGFRATDSSEREPRRRRRIAPVFAISSRESLKATLIEMSRSPTACLSLRRECSP